MVRHPVDYQAGYSHGQPRDLLYVHAEVCADCKFCLSLFIIWGQIKQNSHLHKIKNGKSLQRDHGGEHSIRDLLVLHKISELVAASQIGYVLKVAHPQPRMNKFTPILSKLMSAHCAPSCHNYTAFSISHSLLKPKV